MTPASTNVFLQIAKYVEVTRGKIWAVPRMLKCLPVKSLKLIRHQIVSMGTGVIKQKDDSVQQHLRAFWIYGASQHPQPPRNEPHLSALLCLPPLPMLEEHTLHYAHLQSNKETTVWTFAFSLCMFSTLQMVVSIRNNNVASFWEECVLWWMFGFHLNPPHICNLRLMWKMWFRKYEASLITKENLVAEETLANDVTIHFNKVSLTRTITQTVKGIINVVTRL